MTKGLGAASSNGLFGAGAASSSEQDLGLKMSADERAEWDAAKRELSAIINVLASMIGIGVAVYMVGGGYALGTVRPAFVHEGPSSDIVCAGSEWVLRWVAPSPLAPSRPTCTTGPSHVATPRSSSRRRGSRCNLRPYQRR